MENTEKVQACGLDRLLGCNHPVSVERERRRRAKRVHNGVDASDDVSLAELVHAFEMSGHKRTRCVGKRRSSDGDTPLPEIIV